MKSSKFLVLIGSVMLAVLLLGGLVSCEDLTGLNLVPDIKGVWHDDWTELVISDYLYTPTGTSSGVSNYSAQIIEHVDGEWNGGDTGEGIHGYFVIQYNDTPYWYASGTLDDKFMIVRWQNLTFSTGTFQVEYSEGSNDSNFGDDQPGDVFDTAAAAKAGATTSSGHFGGFSNLER